MVKGRVHTGYAREGVPRPASVSPCRTDDGKLGASPQQDAYVRTVGGAAKGISQGDGLAPPRELEVRRGVPPGEVDTVLGALDESQHRGERLLPVDQDLRAVAAPHREARDVHQGLLGVERCRPTDALQPPLVLPSDHRLDQSPGRIVKAHAERVRTPLGTARHDLPCRSGARSAPYAFWPPERSFGKRGGSHARDPRQVAGHEVR